MTTAVRLKLRVLFPQKASKQLKSLKPVFRELCEVHERYINAEPLGEISFWHRERSQTGLLAAAAWRCDETALEEYACERPNRRGRRDLYIRSKTAVFECEAKYLFVDLADIEKSVSRVYESLNVAAKQAKSLGDVERRLALCFVTPRINELGRGEIDECLRQLIDGLKKPAKGRSQYDALVWIHSPEPFPDDKRRWFYSGLLLVVKETIGRVVS